jgi:cobalt-zinc-cadmium efflux system protein
VPAHTHFGHSHHDAAAAAPPGGDRALRSVLALTAGFMLVEAAAGFWTNSLALISDAGHMLTDVAALSLALFALWFSRREAPRRLTYGYLRVEILAALVNGVALLALTLSIFVEAAQRLRQPPEVLSREMLVVAAVGLVVNLVSLAILTRSGGETLNERGALLHVLGDVLGSVGAMVAAVLIGWGWKWADPVASALIGLLILRSTWALLREAVQVLLEGTPPHLNVDAVHAAMRSVPGVEGVSDLHLWSLASGYDALSAHVIVPEVERSDAVRVALRGLLLREFGIRHTTLEVQRPGEPPQDGCGGEVGRGGGGRGESRR